MGQSVDTEDRKQAIIGYWGDVGWPFDATGRRCFRFRRDNIPQQQCIILRQH